MEARFRQALGDAPYERGVHFLRMVQNLLLAVVPETERRRIEPYCERVELPPRARLCAPDEPPPYAYFPLNGVCSSLVHAQNGEAVEVGLIGREGMVGLSLVLGEAANPFEIIVQVRGSALRIERNVFVSRVLQTGHSFCDALLKYTNLYLATVAQTAVCNRVHRIEQRLARWLLEVSDRADTNVLPMTHEVLALMLGAYRPSITNALKVLQERGIVQVGRGRLTILDENRLEAEACECHQAIRRRTAATLREIRRMAA
ncbi:MAG TPA: Crp/Fnr family transcriptional regulator [Candidatus Baltobacteraceae bacterium]|nr:Crp/Fnr family transcriptional regulator [Candidatus Baltobacteraceae bacterium]